MYRAGELLREERIDSRGLSRYLARRVFVMRNQRVGQLLVRLERGNVGIDSRCRRT